MITCAVCHVDTTGHAIAVDGEWRCPRHRHRPRVDTLMLFLLVLATATVLAMTSIVVALCTRGL